MTQAGCYQLVLDRKLGESRLPDEWVVIAAGNPASERGVHFSMPRPLRNRFVHLDLEPDLDDWCKWAVKAHVRPEIIAFLRFKPELLHDGDATSDANAWPTPRSWEMASRVLSGMAQRTNARLLSGTSEFEAQLLDGTVGQAAASELTAFLRLFRELPSIDEILLNPSTAKVPSEPSAQIAIATALGRVLSDTSVGRGVTYLERMPTEMRVMAMRDAAGRDSAIAMLIGTESKYADCLTAQVDDASRLLDVFSSLSNLRSPGVKGNVTFVRRLNLPQPILLIAARQGSVRRACSKARRCESSSRPNGDEG